MPGKWRGLADAAEQLRGSAANDGAAGLIPSAEAEARRTAALILDDWQQHVSGDEPGPAAVPAGAVPHAADLSVQGKQTVSATATPPAITPGGAE